MGYACTVNCSGHDAGYQWAEDHDIDDEDDCGGNSESFIEGCKAYVQENAADASSEEADDSGQVVMSRPLGRQAILEKTAAGVSFWVSLYRQSTAGMSGKSGTDARFPSRVRQNILIGGCVMLTVNQEVGGSSPPAPVN
jgi:hypothetical protein